MKVSQPNPPVGRFDQMFQMASEATGTSFEYLLATAERESSLRPDLQASTSSATGLFQFVEQTWLSMVKAEGAELGLSSFADVIVVDASGRATVSDPNQRQTILDLRKDPTLSAIMAGRLTKRNATHLEQALGRTPTDGELYIAHFMGSAGASRLIDLATRDPLASAADAFPRAAQANRSIFFDRSGRARSAAEVYTDLVARHPDAASQLAAARKASSAATPQAEAAASRVAVAFSALSEAAASGAPQSFAPGFDAFRAKARAEPFTARASDTADPFTAILQPRTDPASAPVAATAGRELGYAATKAARPLQVPVPSALNGPGPATPPSTAMQPTPGERRSRFVTDPSTWGGALPRRAPSPAVEAETPARLPAASPATIASPVASSSRQPPATAPDEPQPRPSPMAGIVATASGPANANRTISRTGAGMQPLDLTSFLSYRVRREPKDLLPPL